MDTHIDGNLYEMNNFVVLQMLHVIGNNGTVYVIFTQAYIVIMLQWYCTCDIYCRLICDNAAKVVLSIYFSMHIPFIK